MNIKEILFDECGRNNTWGERFYTSNITIIGLGLSDCEIDLWWLLTHRAYLYYSNYCGLRERIKNNIIYYDIVDDVKRNNQEDEIKRYRFFLEQERKHRLLESDHVIVKKFYLSESDNDYASAYENIFYDICKGRLG